MVRKLDIQQLLTLTGMPKKESLAELILAVAESMLLTKPESYIYYF
jgi:hypothetical protein